MSPSDIVEAEVYGALDELLQSLAESQSRATRRTLAERYDSETLDRFIAEAESCARAIRSKTESQRRRSRDAMLARRSRERRD